MSTLYLIQTVPPIVGAFVSIIIGVSRWRYLDYATKFLWLNNCAGFVVETLAIYIAVKFKNNMALYAVYSLVEFGLVMAYFNYSVEPLRRKNIGIFLGVFGIFAGVLNAIYLEKITEFNAYFLYLEGTIIIGLAFFSFYQLVRLSEDLHLFRLRHFWLPFILCSFWTISYLNWGLHEYFEVHLQQWIWLINTFVSFLSCLTYLAFGLVFWKFPKLKPTYE